MLITHPPDIPTSEITHEALYWNRREFLKAAGLGVAAAGLLPSLSRFARDDEK
ncbi:MAG: twin-arginine translocation signal domain-containing protein, partial [Gemmatimonadales bacterium]